VSAISSVKFYVAAVYATTSLRNSTAEHAWNYYLDYP